MKILFFISFFLQLFLCSAQKSASLINLCDHEPNSKIIFFRSPNLKGMASNYNLFLNDSLITEIKNRSFFVVNLEAGNKIFTARNSNFSALGISRSSLKINVQPSRTYFVKCGVITPPLGKIKKAQPFIEWMNKDQVQFYLRKRFLRRKLRKILYRDFLNTL